MEFIPQLLFIIIGPAILVLLLKGKKIAKVLSPVVLAYALGIAAATFDLIPLNFKISKNFSEISIMLAIPLLLFSANILGWLRYAKFTVLSFIYAIIAALVACVSMGFAFHPYIEDIWNYSGMLTGVYTGGTANMQAVGIAIEAPESSFALINSVEIVCGGLYLLFLTSFAPVVFGKFLPAYKPTNDMGDEDEKPVGFEHWGGMLIAVFLAAGILAITVGLTQLIYREMTNQTFIIIVLTTLSVLASFSPQIRSIKGSFEVGDYLLLVFCVAVGMRSDFSEMVDKGGMLLLYTACTWILSVLIHFILSVFSKIDRDTTLITSTAALYGPAFIGQIASVLKNREIVFAGIATGLVGYAVGNYLGIGVFYFLQSILSN